MANSLYKEETRFRNYLAISLLVAGILAAAYGIVWAVGRAAYPDVLIYSTIMIGLIVLTRWVLRLRLKVKVTDKSIKYRMSPLHGKSRKIRWEEVDRCEIVRTPTLAPDHKSSLGLGGEQRFSLTGRNGLSILTKAGKRYFIGCRNVEELRDSLQQVAG